MILKEHILYLWYAYFTLILRVSCAIKWGSVTHQMAVPVPSISCCVLNHHNLFYQIQNALAFNQDTCCHLALCLQLLSFHCMYCYSSSCGGRTQTLDLRIMGRVFYHWATAAAATSILRILPFAIAIDWIDQK